MPVDSSIALGVKAPQFINPQQMMSLQQVQQQMQMQNMQIEEYGRKRQEESALRSIYAKPDALDKTTGLPTDSTLSEIAKVSPTNYLATRAKMIEANEKRATMEKNIEQARKSMDDRKRGVLDRLSTVGEGAYNSALETQKDPAAASQAAQQATMEAYTTMANSGLIDDKWKPEFEKNLGQPFHIEGAKLWNQAARPKGTDVAAEKLANPPEPAAKETPTMTEAAALYGKDTPAYRAAIAKSMDKRTNIVVKAGGADNGFEGRNGEIMASLAERGASLPAGLRSKEQQKGLLNALSKKYPDLTPDAIAEKVVKGQLDLTGLKKEVSVAGTAAGKIAYAENEIKEIIPFVREASAKLPRGQFVPYEKLKQMGEGAFSNPDLAEFKSYMQTLSNSYDLLAARGGTDMEKRKENRRQFDTAQSPEALERIMQVVLKEAQASGRAAKKSMDVTRKDDTEPPARRASDKSNDPLGIR